MFIYIIYKYKCYTGTPQTNKYLSSRRSQNIFNEYPKNQYCGLKNPHQNAMKSEIKYVILFNNSITGNYKTQINGLVKGKIFIFQVMMRIYM